MSGRSLRERLRWCRDRAKQIICIGLLCYCVGLFLDWLFELESSWILRWIGIALGIAGTASSLWWLADPVIERAERDRR